ncbi:MAG: hypothetical protein NTW03_03990, partial [Verrucomicrobia bacterium]|nr:hypothetical protein [Verrucomicrobiota bacterium]
MRIVWKIPLLLGGLLVCAGATYGALQLPLQFSQDTMLYNLQSLRGVPISSVSDNPTGSDGRMPVGLKESGTGNLTTPNQFRGYTAFGGVPAHTDWAAVSNSPSLRGTNAFSALVATEMQLPCAYSGT